MKKIIFVHLFNDRSGSPKVLLQTMRALSNAGYQVELFTSSHKGGFLDSAPGLRHTLFYRRHDNKWLTLLYYALSQILLFFQCLQFFRKDVVFHINTMMPFGAALAAKLMRKKVVYHVHESSIRPKLLKFFLRSVIRISASHVILVSKFLKFNEGFSGKDFLIYNALELAPTDQGVKINNDFSVLMVCSLKRYKGVDEFLKVAKKVSSMSKKINFTLVLNASEKEISKYFVGVTFPDNLTVYSRQENLEGFYSSSSILINLSRPNEWVETFGLTLLEGMSYSLPVIAPPVGGPAEIIQHGVQGFLIDSSEIDNIASSIAELEKNSTLYYKMSRNAHERSLDFTPDSFAANIVNFYQLNI